MPVSQRQWHNVHVYYFSDNQDYLILDAIRPLFAQLTDQIEQAFFVRHWLRGPHLRLRFVASDAQIARLISPAIERHVSTYLCAHPSTTTIDIQQMLPIYEALAEQEGEAGPFVPLQPNNSIMVMPYEQRLHAVHRPELLDIIEDFYVQTNELVFAMLDAIRGGVNRLTLSLALMIATGHTCTSHITSGFMSYRSHAELFIIRSPDPALVRKTFEEQYLKHAQALQRQLGLVLDTLDHQHTAFPFVTEWASLIRRYYERADVLIALGADNPLVPANDLTPEQQALWHARVSKSDFHQTREENRAHWEHMIQQAWFQRYRLAQNLLYLHLSRLGVRPVERAMLGHFVANVVEARFGVSATALIGRPA